MSLSLVSALCSLLSALCSLVSRLSAPTPPTIVCARDRDSSAGPTPVLSLVSLLAPKAAPAPTPAPAPSRTLGLSVRRVLNECPQWSAASEPGKPSKSANGLVGRGNHPPLLTGYLDGRPLVLMLVLCCWLALPYCRFTFTAGQTGSCSLEARRESASRVFSCVCGIAPACTVLHWSYRFC